MDPSRFKLPGFGLPLSFTPSEDDLFPSALDEVEMEKEIASLPLISIREMTMLRLMNQLTDKPDWNKKILNKEIASKWKSEALATKGLDISKPMVDWCIAELKYKAKIFKKTGAVSIFNGDVVKSDTAIPEDLKEKLKLAVAPLENVPAQLRDWHPESDEKVLDLVHPSLFPLAYGRTRILPDSLTSLEDCIKRCGEGVVIPVPPKETRHSSSYSSKFQWLPCEVDISSDVKITSYINNLHPQLHQDLYSVVEQVIAKAIPLWNMTLTPLRTQSYHEYRRISYNPRTYRPSPDPDEEPERLPNEDDDAYDDRTEQWYIDIRQIVQPEPYEFMPPPKPQETVDLRRDFGKRGIQVIVKLANIHLTPEKPKYEGGSWHVEGQLNEHICSTALYYYDSLNITTSRLAFRQIATTDDYPYGDIDYPRNHEEWLPAVFGIENYSPAVQEVGAVDTKEGRLVTFPNVLQHQVQPFQLADPTKPGHRKILALFLVDPNIRVISTANVPCQQRTWWSDAIRECGKSSALASLPVELQDQIFEAVEDFPVGLDEAKYMRLRLMKERKRFVASNSKAFQAHEFSLCEH